MLLAQEKEEKERNEGFCIKFPVLRQSFPL